MTVTERRPAGTVTGWPVKASKGGLLGLALVAVLVLVAGLAMAWSAGQPAGYPALAGFVLASLLVGLAFGLSVAAAGYYRLRYQFDSASLIIKSGAPAERIPLRDIDGIYAGQRIGTVRRVRGLSWPGYYVGLVRSRSLGTLRLFCTDLALDALSVIVTPARTVVLSPADPVAFRRELIQRIEAGESPPGSPATDDGRPGGGLPRPWLAASVGLALALLFSALLAVLASYATLAPVLSPPLPDAGQPSQSAGAAAVLQWPLLGAVLLGLNLIVAWVLRSLERAAPILLCATSGLVEAVVLMATLRLLP